MRFSPAVLSCVAAVALCGSAQAGIIAGSLSETIVESRTGGINFPAYSEGTTADALNNWQTSTTAKSSAPGTTAGIGSRFNTTAAFGGAATWFQTNPTLPTAGGTYDVYVTVSSASGNLTATSGVTASGGTGLPASTNAFTVNSVTQPGNKWNLVGTLTLNSGVSLPGLRFSETTHSNRFYADAVLFAEVQTIPEPSTLALLAVGMVGAFAARRRSGL